MKVFITGGTGFIGTRLTEKLISEEHNVTLLVRNPSRAVFKEMDKTSLVIGDLSDKEALKKGMKDCDWVFHMAAFTKPWAKDPSTVFMTNVTGTVNVIDTALECKVKKVIITSTGGTMGYSNDGKPVDESANPAPEYNTLYEKTKAEAEKIALEYTKKGLDLVIVNPTRVYGPGKLTKSNSLTRIIRLYISGLWRIIPGNGESVGNYVFIDDIIEGHILAARYGRSGERYILGGENLSFRDLIKIIGESAGKKRIVFNLPLVVMKRIVKLIMLFSKITGTPPVITMDWLDKYMNNWIISSDKAAKELGYKVTPFREGVSKTIQWLLSKQNGIRK
jgi:NAD+-dependent farnesol dehydrogenase